MTTMEPGRRRTGLVLAVMLAFAGVIFLGRLWHARAPLDSDICAYAVIGHEMTVGHRPLYSDLWERKPPLLYLAFAAAEQLTTYGRPELLLLATVSAWATLAGVYGAARGHGGPLAGLVAAGLWTLLCADLNLGAEQPSTEALINAALVPAVALLFCSARRPRPRWAMAIVVGGLLAGATLVKHNAALACLALLAGHVALPVGRRWLAVAESTVAGGAVVLAWAILFARAYAVERLDATVDVLFRQNVAYSGGGFGHNLLAGLTWRGLFPPFLGCLIAPVALIACGWLGARRGRRFALGRHRLLWAAWLVGTWATIVLTGALYPRYYQLWLPPACVGAAWSATRLWRGPVGRLIVVVAVGAVVVRQAMPFATLTPAQWMEREAPYLSVANQNELAERLNGVLRPDETVWAMGSDNAVYFLCHRSPPSGFLFFDPLMYGGRTAESWRRLHDDLDRRRPDVIVFSSDWMRIMNPTTTPIFPWIVEHYQPWQEWQGTSTVPQATTYTLWAKKGSRLAGKTNTERE